MLNGDRQDGMGGLDCIVNLGDYQFEMYIN